MNRHNRKIFGGALFFGLCVFVLVPTFVFAQIPAATLPTKTQLENPKKVKIDLSDKIAKNQAAPKAGIYEKQRFETALALMNAEKWADAAFEWWAIGVDKQSAEFHLEAQYQLAKATYKLGFFNASLFQFQRIIKKGPAHPRYHKSVEWLFFISRKLTDETAVLEELAKFKDLDWPKQYRHEYRYLLAKYEYLRAYDLELRRLQQKQKEQFRALEKEESESHGMDFSATTLDLPASKPEDPNMSSLMEFSVAESELQRKTEKIADIIKQAFQYIDQIPKESRYYPRAQYLEGLLEFLKGDDQRAVNAFKNVVQVLNPEKGRFLDKELRQSAFLALARTHFGYKQYRASLFYYEKIERDSDAWLDAIFESSWAHFHLQDYERALGGLVTLQAPQFYQEYYPESYILLAASFFDNCRYPETREIVTQFEQRYRPLMENIKKLNALHLTAGSYFQKLTDLYAASSQQDTMGLILKVALSDQEIRKADAAVREAQNELKQIRLLPRPLNDSVYAKQLVDDVSLVLQNRLNHAGELSKIKLDTEVYHLQNLLSQAYRIQFETISEEKSVLESKLGADEVADAKQRLHPFSLSTDAVHIAWPFDGEYWDDELGTYHYVMAKGCK